MSFAAARSGAVAPRPYSSHPPNLAGSADPLLEVRNLRVAYWTERGPIYAVDDVSFDLRPGEVFGLAGESGSGKSTVAGAILRTLQPPAVIAGGRVRFRGQDVLAMDDDDLAQFRWRDVSMVFQSAMNSLNPVMTVGDQIVDTIQAHIDVGKRTARARAAELLDLVGIEGRRIDSYPHQLSGGMRQRATIAMALALDPPLMIMDEPTTALDVVVQGEIMGQIAELKEKLGFSILFITHDLSLLVEFSTRIAIMYAGEIVELAPASELYSNPLHPYTQGLLSSFPTLHGPKVQLTGIPGNPPDMAKPPSGCRFHPRCPQCRPMHTQVVPKLREITPGHFVACHLVE